MKKLSISLLFCVMLSVSLLSAQDMDTQKTALTRVETSFAAIAAPEGEALRQFGYDLLGQWASTSVTAVDPSYVVAYGDMLRIYIWGDPVDYGAVLGSYEIEIDSDGAMFFAPLGRLSVYGRSIQQIKELILEQLLQKYKNVSIDVTLGRMREFPIYVSGFVSKPGAVMVSRVRSVAEVLGLAGGILPEGSLRSVQLIRSGKRTVIDLYGLFLSGDISPVTIKMLEGDVLYVPPIGTIAAVTGEVKRPGIYELKSSETFKELLSFAGGSGIAGSIPQARILRRSGADRTVLERAIGSAELLAEKVQDGDALVLQSGKGVINNSVEIRGEVRFAGLYDISKNAMLSSLLTKAMLLPDTDVHFGTVTRTGTGSDPQVIVFDPERVMQSIGDMELLVSDIVELYPLGDAYADAPIQLSGLFTRPGVAEYRSGMRLLDLLRDRTFTADAGSIEIRVVRDGAVSERIFLRDLLKKGDLTGDVDLRPGDKVVAVTAPADQLVSGIRVLGAVKTPGVYPYSERMTLYDAIRAAGGYTAQAYPQALSLTRESVKQRQVEEFRVAILTAREKLTSYETSLAAQNLSVDVKAVAESQIDAQKALLEYAEEQLGSALGRIILDVPAGLTSLQNSTANIALQEGDVIFIPTQENSIIVLGDVSSMAALPWDPEKSVRSYLFDLGGIRSKDYELTILKYNGSTFTVDNLFDGWSTIESQRLDPGDAIIAVKRMSLPSGSAFMTGLSTVTDMVYKLVYSLNVAGVL